MIVVTGASGFIGRHLVADLRARGEAVRPVVRPGSRTDEGDAVARLDHPDDWPAVLDGATAIVHLAAHNPPRRQRRAFADEAAFGSINVEATARLAERAAAAGLAHFVFTSSIRVYGDGDMAFTEDMPCAADDLYGRSKCEGEAALKAALTNTGTSWTILRPCVTYGPGRGGVLVALNRVVQTGLPVPIPQAGPLISLIYVGNLIAGIGACLADERAKGETFNIADDRPLSYRELAELMAKAAGRKVRIVPVPAPLVRMTQYLPRLGPAFARALAPCVCDDRHIREAIGWTPPYTTAEGFRLAFDMGASAKSR